MLSIEDPPNPPCPSKISELTGDEGGLKKKPALQEAADLVQVAVPGDEIKHQSPFSIRDYVCAARSKDIRVNWPFSQHLLQLCLKHGIKDLLPPFEHPHLVRAQRCREGLGPNQLNALVDSEKTSLEVDLVEGENAGLSDLKHADLKDVACQLFSQSVLKSSDCVQSLSSDVDTLPAEGGDEKLYRISDSVFSDKVCEETAPEALLELEAIKDPQASYKTEALGEPSGKKRRLIVKFGGHLNSVRTEENVSTSSTVTESMTSKICPVCKIFTSTSNTTLNAHIDRCLAADSTSKWLVTNLTKKKMKPRKKKLITDIYLTASCCTLEDLERRNCMNWAVDSNFPMQNREVHTENKRQQMIAFNYIDDSEESMLYDDSNSMKLRALSKLNVAAVPPAVENRKPRKNMIDSKDKSFLISKEKHLASKASKYLNVQPRSKKLCNIMLSKGEIHEAPYRKYHVENNHKKEERPSQLLKAQDPFRDSRSGTLRQWVCSKRMRLLKSLNETSVHHAANEDPLLVTQKPLIQRNRSALANSSVRRSHIYKPSRFSVNSDASPNIQSKTGTLTDDKVISSLPPKGNSNWLIAPAFVGDGHNESFSRSIESNICTSRKRVASDTRTSTPKESSKFSKSFTFTPKAKKCIASEYTSSGKCNENNKHSPWKKRGKLIFKKSLKERCMAEIKDKVVELPFNEDKGINRLKGCNENSGPSDNITVSETEEYACEVFLGRSLVLKSGSEREESVIASDRTESITSKRFLSSKLEGINVDSKVGSSNQFSAEVVTVSADTGITYSVEKPVRDLCHNSLDGQSGLPNSIGEEHMAGSILGDKAWAEPPQDNLDADCTKGDEEEGASSHIMAEVHNLLEGDFSDDQYMGCGSGTELIPIQEPDGGIEALLEKLLVNTSGPGFIEYQQELVNGDPSESPISATTAISSPSMGFSSFKYFEMESSGSDTKQLAVDPVDSERSTPPLSVEGTKSETKYMEANVSPGKESAKILDYEPCCCLQKGSVNRGPSPIQHESPNLMQMTSGLDISMQIYNSFMTHQTLRTDEKVDAASRMLTGPICIKESLDDEVKSLNCTDLNLAGSSSMTQFTSSPMLRLMGQNVMVVNNDDEEEEAMQPSRVPVGTAKNNMTDEENVVQAGLHVGNSTNVEFSNSFRSCSNSKMSPTPPQLPCNHQDHQRMGGFVFSGFSAVKR